MDFSSVHPLEKGVGVRGVAYRGEPLALTINVDQRDDLVEIYVE